MSENGKQTHSEKMYRRAMRNPTKVFWKSGCGDRGLYMSHCGNWSVFPPDAHSSGHDGSHYTLYYRAVRVSNANPECPLGFKTLQEAKDFASEGAEYISKAIDKKIADEREQQEREKENLHKFCEANDETWKNYVLSLLSSIEDLSADVKNASEIVRVLSNNPTRMMSNVSQKILEDCKSRMDTVVLVVRSDLSQSLPPEEMDRRISTDDVD